MRPGIIDIHARGVFRAADLMRGQGQTLPVTGAGAPEIDAALPWGGLPRGLHEIAAPAGDAAGAGFAAMLLRRRPGAILWCRSRRAALEAGDPYGPGLAALGIAADRLIIVEAVKPAELLWAMEEGARSRGLASVVAEGATPDLTASRRLQLAAEAGDCLLLLLPNARDLPLSAALTRWRVRSEPSLPEAGGPGKACWSVELWRCRAGGRPQSWMVEWNDATLSMSVAAALADRPLAAAG